MTRIWYFIDCPEKEISGWLEINQVMVGTSQRDLRKLSRVVAIVKRHSWRYYFEIRDEKVIAFIHRIIESGFHPIKKISIHELHKRLLQNHLPVLNR